MKRSRLLQAVAVDRSRDELLADAALALKKHRRVGRRRALDRVPHLAERRALANHLVTHFHGTPERAVFVGQARPLERVPDRHQELFARRRLLDEVERAGLGRLDGGADSAVPGDDHDGQVVVRGAQLLQHLESVHPRHLDIQEDEVRDLLLGERDAFRSARGLDDVVVVVPQDHPDGSAHLRLVIDDQNACLHRNVLAISRRRPSPASAGRPWDRSSRSPGRRRSGPRRRSADTRPWSASAVD